MLRRSASFIKIIISKSSLVRALVLYSHELCEERKLSQKSLYSQHLFCFLLNSETFSSVDLSFTLFFQQHAEVRRYSHWETRTQTHKPLIVLGRKTL